MLGRTTIAALVMLFCCPGARGQPATVAAPAAGPSVAADDGEPQEQYALAKNAFYYQDYDRTIALLTPLLAPEVRLASKEQVLLAREMLGASVWWRQKTAAFREQFTRLLQDNPRFELDAFYYPPEMVRDFTDLKVQLVDAGLIQVPADESPRKRLRVESNLYAYTPFALTLVPFGVGQFANGNEGAGVLFLTLESSLLAVNIMSWTWLYAGNPHGTARTASVWTMYSSLGLLTASALWGIIHAVVNHQPERLLRQETIDREVSLPDPPLIAPGIPGGVSLGLGWIGWEALF